MTKETKSDKAMTPPPASTAIEVFDYEGDEGGGFENQTAADRKLPMLVILQSNSPEVAASKGKLYAGQIYNTITEEATDYVEIVAATTDHCWLQFVPRDAGGGFRGRHKLDSQVLADAVKRNKGRAFGKLPVPGGIDPKTGKQEPDNELVEAFEVYAITTKDNEVTGFATMSFTSTKIKAYKAWNTQLGMFQLNVNGKKVTVPLFAHRVKISTVAETNKHGTFFVPVIEPAAGGTDLRASLMAKTDPRYQAAKKLREDVNAGLARAAYETVTQDAAPDNEGAAPF